MLRESSQSSDDAEREAARARKRVSTIIDGAGALLVAATVGWLLLAGLDSDADATASVSLVLVAALTYAITAAISRSNAWIVALYATILAAVFAVARIPALYAGPTEGPLGYSNAAGALFLGAAACALIVVARAHRISVRAAALICAVAFASVPILNGATAAGGLVLLLPLALLAGGETGKRLTVGASATAVVLSFVTTVVLATRYRPDDGVAEWIDATLSERRLMLWNDAVALMRRNPVLGIGPGRFEAVSPTALMDRDTIWPHSELLHFGSEAGVVGLLLLAALFAWCFVRLWGTSADRGTAIAAAGVGAILVNSNIDCILHYPAIVIVGAVLVAVGANPPRRRRSRPMHYYPVEDIVVERIIIEEPTPPQPPRLLK